ncbi:MAG TPA: FadR/GntR family transcriptional regulator [Candidatus Nanopelagicaceae bacterium]
MAGSQEVDITGTFEMPPVEERVTIPSSFQARPTRLSYLVISSLMDQIISGSLSTGFSLPPEPVLCQDFKVSRSVIRESVKLLEEKGLVVARQGQGTTVQPIDQWNLLDPLVLDAYIRNDQSLTIYDDLIEVRAALEGQMARRAAVTMSESQLEDLYLRLQGLESLLDDPNRYATADLAYHDLINRYSGHVLARSIIRTFQPIALVNAYYGRTHRSREDNMRSHLGHAKIYEEILMRNPEGAAKAVEDHILGSWETYKQSLLDSNLKAD